MRFSHTGIAGSVPTLREGPVDVLHRTLYPAGLAVQAVGEVDLKLAILHAVHLRRTEPSARRTELRPAFCALVAVKHLQVARLVLFMDCTAHEYIRKAIRHYRRLHV